MSDITIDNGIMALRGVKEKRAGLYHKLGVFSIADLLEHYPRGYVDLSAPLPITQAPLDTPVAVRAMVGKKRPPAIIRKNMQIFKLTAFDDSGEMTVTFFNNRYAFAALKEGEEYLFYGRLSGNMLLRDMSSPQVEPIDSPPFLPVYPLTTGLSNRMIITNVKESLGLLPDDYADPLPAEMRERYGLIGKCDAVRLIHFPADRAAIEQARRRLVFEELLTLSLALAQLGARSRDDNVHPIDAALDTAFTDALPFTLTGAQRRAIDDCLRDMAGSHTMNRLVQGDVGSGKTVVAAACMYAVWQRGHNACLMAPTEILANQHHHTLSSLLEPLGVPVLLLTGAAGKRDRQAVKERYENGGGAILVGTHALIASDFDMGNTALVVTDEQHRFGVRQRGHLYERGEHPHMLVMSATPIPRTLALFLHGDLDVSVIDELPKGRRAISTYAVGSDKRQRAYNFIKKHLDEGRQAFIVCPAVDESDSGLASAVEYAQRLSTNDFRDYRVGLVHGKLGAKQKDAVMQAFYGGDIQLLISTTVIEVGIDVPNAVIMLIENAERFGLSQLHQLRGRVGRGAYDSYCILISDAQGETARARLRVMTQTQDGFKIAQEDLALRGPGDFFGDKQHGVVTLKLADIASDTATMAQVEQVVRDLKARDPQLTRPEHAALRARSDRLIGSIGQGGYN